MSGGLSTPADLFCGCLEHAVCLCRDADSQVTWLLQGPEKPEQHVVPGEWVRVWGCECVCGWVWVGECVYVRMWGYEYVCGWVCVSM